jgi:hypothetical protein
MSGLIVVFAGFIVAAMSGLIARPTVWRVLVTVLATVIVLVVSFHAPPDPISNRSGRPAWARDGAWDAPSRRRRVLLSVSFLFWLGRWVLGIAFFAYVVYSLLSGNQPLP